MTIRSFENKKAIKEYKFIKFNDGAVENSTSSKDDIIGVSDCINSNENSVSDIYLNGEVAELTLGGTVSAGDALTSDSDGNGVKAKYGDNIGAIALSDGVKDECINVIVHIQRFFAESVSPTTPTTPTTPSEPTSPSEPA